MNVAAPPFNVLSLCSGAGGLDLSVKRAIRNARTVCYVENEVTAAGVLVARMEEERLDDAPLWTDLRTFDGRPWRGSVQAVIGGYPCQPFSVAGRRRGVADPRHLWPEVRRIVSEVQPASCFFENVGGHLRLGFSDIARDLHGMGFRVAATLLTAQEVGAPHRRERLFILAVADSNRGCRGTESWEQHQTRATARAGRHDRAKRGGRAGGSQPASGCGAMADAARLVQREPDDEARTQSWEDARGIASRDGSTVANAGRERPQWLGEDRPAPGPADRSGRTALPYWPPGPEDHGGWRKVLTFRPELAPAVESPLRGVVDGVAGGLGRSDQLHILGNGVVPQQAEYAFRLLAEEFAQ